MPTSPSHSKLWYFVQRKAFRYPKLLVVILLTIEISRFFRFKCSAGFAPQCQILLFSNAWTKILPVVNFIKAKRRHTAVRFQLTAGFVLCYPEFLLEALMTTSELTILSVFRAFIGFSENEAFRKRVVSGKVLHFFFGFVVCLLLLFVLGFNHLLKSLEYSVKIHSMRLLYDGKHLTVGVTTVIVLTYIFSFFARSDIALQVAHVPGYVSNVVTWLCHFAVSCKEHYYVTTWRFVLAAVINSVRNLHRCLNL